MRIDKLIKDDEQNSTGYRSAEESEKVCDEMSMMIGVPQGIDGGCDQL